MRPVRDPWRPRHRQPHRLERDELWEAILVAGEEFSIRVIAPSQARRIEAGIFNYGSDITLADTPFHVMGLERLVEEQPRTSAFRSSSRRRATAWRSSPNTAGSQA